MSSYKSSSSSKLVSDVVHGLKYTFSGLLLAFSVAVVMTGKQEGKTLPRAGSIVLFWILIVYLASVEGCQNCLVGLQTTKPEEYEATHRISRISTRIAHLPGNIEKFIMGRQLLVVVVVFSINLLGSTSNGCSSSFTTPDIITEILCSSGLALIFVTIMLGQLTSQIISTTCMLDFVNNYVMVFTTYLSIAIEFSGILHNVHLLRLLFDTYVVRKVPNVEDKREGAFTKMFFWGRVLASLLALGLVLTRCSRYDLTLLLGLLSQ